MRSTGAIILLVVALLVGFAGCSGCASYNSLIGADEDVNAQWANLQSQYQRRADLIPNLVSTVEGAAAFESGTLQDVVEARTRAVNVNLSADDLDDPAALQRFSEAQAGLGAATGALINAVREDYPDLSATENFLSLQDQLEGTENRIATERRRYNEVATDFNRRIRSFPTTIWAGVFGFDQRVPFEADAGSQNAPTVDFEG